MFSNYYLHIISHDKQNGFHLVEINCLNIFSEFLGFLYLTAYDGYIASYLNFLFTLSIFF